MNKKVLFFIGSYFFQQKKNKFPSNISFSCFFSYQLHFIDEIESYQIACKLSFLKRPLFNISALSLSIVFLIEYIYFMKYSSNGNVIRKVFIIFLLIKLFPLN